VTVPDPFGVFIVLLLLVLFGVDSGVFVFLVFSYFLLHLSFFLSPPKFFMGLRYFMWVDVVKWLPNNQKSEEIGGLI
jgi:hypothetical protein